MLTAGVPGPWGEAAKGLFYVKAIPYVAVVQEGGAANEELRRWTGHANAPIVVSEDEPPRTVWSEIIFAAERRAAEPALIPVDAADRAAMFGLCHEICGENGLGWSRRLMIIHRGAARSRRWPTPPRATAVRRLGLQATATAPEAAAKPRRRAAAEILALLSSRLRGQREARQLDYFVGDWLAVGAGRLPGRPSPPSREPAATRICVPCPDYHPGRVRRRSTRRSSRAAVDPDPA